MGMDREIVKLELAIIHLQIIKTKAWEYRKRFKLAKKAMKLSKKHNIKY